MNLIDNIKNWHANLKADIINTQAVFLLVLIGIWLCLGHVFTTYPVAFALMRSIATEKVWGTGFILVGVLYLYSLITNKTGLQKNLLLVQGAVWSALAVNMVYGDWHAISLPIWVTFAVSAFRVYLTTGK